MQNHDSKDLYYSYYIHSTVFGKIAIVNDILIRILMMLINMFDMCHAISSVNGITKIICNNTSMYTVLCYLVIDTHNSSITASNQDSRFTIHDNNTRIF